MTAAFKYFWVKILLSSDLSNLFITPVSPVNSRLLLKRENSHHISLPLHLSERERPNRGRWETTSGRKERLAGLLWTLHCWCIKWKISPQGHKDSSPLKMHSFCPAERCLPISHLGRFSLRHLITMFMCSRFGRGVLSAPITHNVQMIFNHGGL